MRSILEKALLIYGDRVAYITGNSRVLYRELYEKSTCNAKLLMAQGTGPVIMYGHKEPEMLEGIVSCILAGRAYVPIDSSIPEGRIANIIKQCGATLLINAGKEKCPCGEYLCKKLEDYKEMPPLKNDNDTAYIIFTSGSTGMPKGIPISYGNLKNFVLWISGIEGFRDAKEEVIVNQANFNFDLSVADIFFSLVNGHTLLALDRTEISDVAGAFLTIAEKKASFMVLTPSYLSILLSDPDFNCEHFPNIKCIYLCGETLEKNKARRTLERFPNLILINAYGPSEATSAVTSARITQGICDRYQSLPVGVVDDAATTVLIEDGEIVLEGPSVFSGYLGDIQGGYYYENSINKYKTGDKGHIEDGLLFFDGRMDFQIKYKGYRIELQEIEEVIMGLEEVTDCVVIPKTDKAGRVMFIKAYVFGNISDVFNIKERISGKLPDYMIPKTIRILDKFPLNSNGKIDRKELDKYD